MTPDERLKLQKDLANARGRHAPDGKARARPARAPARPEKPLASGGRRYVRRKEAAN
jgi:hypothetical protein